MTRRAADTLLGKAIALHHAGRLSEAAALYERILAGQPGHPDALFNLSVLHHTAGRHAAAAQLLVELVQRQPGHAQGWRVLGLAMRALRHPDAELALRRALADAPADADLSAELGLALLESGRHAEAEAVARPALAAGARTGKADSALLRFVLGSALQGQGRAEAAAAEYRRCLSLDGGFGAALNNLGLVLFDLHQPDAAIAALRRALAVGPDDATALNNLGSGLDGRGEVAAADALYRRALRLRPEYPRALNNLGNLRSRLHDAETAAALRRRAAAAQPDYADPYTMLGSAALERDQPAEAARLHRRTLRLDPGHVCALTNLGLAMQIAGRLAEAEAMHRRAVIHDPTYAEANANLGLLHWLRREGTMAERWLARALRLDERLGPTHLNLGLIRLEEGDLARGWPEYQWRFRAKGYVDRAIPAPQWSGEDLTGRSVLVWREQGIGDELMFSGCYADLAARAGRVVIECDRRLVSLFARSFPTALVRRETVTAQGTETIVPADVDVHAPAGRLPMLLRGRLSAFPSRLGWLVPDPARLAAWRERLAALGPGLKVGIGWRSQMMTTERRAAYTRLEEWGPLFAVPGVRFVNLQYDDCAAEIAGAERRFGVTIHRWSDLDLKDDFEGTAALIANLDLVLSPAMSMGELAGALGVPVWRFGGLDWTRLGSGVRPWFPSMRLFQPRPGEDLGAVLARMAAELRRLASGAPPARAADGVVTAADGGADRFDADGAMEDAVARYRAGDLAGAAGQARRVLAERPGHAVAPHLLGVIARRQGDAATAVRHFQAATAADPGNAAAHAGMADALHSLGRPDAADAAQRNALAAQPDGAEHWVNRAARLRGSGETAAAERACRRAARLRPTLALAHVHLGLLLAGRGRREDAAAAYRRALTLDPASAEALTNLGTALLERERFADAETAQRRALAVDGRLAAAWTNRGNALAALGRPGEAEAAHRRAIDLDPRFADAHANLGLLLTRQGRPEEAEAAYRQALAIDPRAPQPHYNLAFLLLERGDLRRGWPEHDWRFATPEVRGHARGLPMRLWRGENVNAARVLVWREQGLGDELLFASCYADLIARARHVIIECDRRLVGLFARAFPQATVRAATGMPTDADVQVPAGTLPRHLRPDLRRFPERPAWLIADAARVALWRRRLAALGPGLTVGIGWRSSLMTAERQSAYTRLEEWGPLFAVPGVRFVNLQYDDCAAEIAGAERRFGVTIHRWSDLDLKDDLEGAAALVANLDLVISPAMSAGELAGALGVPVWRFGGRDWTQLGSGVRPWYPSMRLFAPRPGEALADVLARIAAVLRRLSQTVPLPTSDPDPDALLEEAAGRHRRGDAAGAAPLYARVLSQRPDDPVALHLSGLLAHQGGDPATGEARIAEALRHQPDYGAALVSLGTVRLALDRAAGAAAAFHRALSLSPDDAAALTNLGNALEALFRPEEGERCQRRALALTPGFAEAHDNRGAVLLRLGRPAEAEAEHRAALRLAPGLAPARLNLAIALRDLARGDEAMVHARAALALDPGDADTLAGLARLHGDAPRADAAMVWGGRALAVEPGHAGAAFNRGVVALRRGDLATGWAGYDQRFRDRAFGAPRRVPAPLWQGEDLTGKRILVWREQGVGDEILFASCLPDLLARARRVVVECDRRLVPLFGRSFPGADVRPIADPAPPDVDVHAPIGTLARWLRPSLAVFPPRAGYLRPDPARLAEWAGRLAALGTGLKVGIGWRSGLVTAERASAYTRLEEWGPLFAVPGVRFVNLQYGECEAELAAAEERFGVTIHRWPDLDIKDDFDGTAALTAGLDLVIAPATAVGELAGALGVPVWRFAGADWTRLGTAARPWFPSMRVFEPGPGGAMADTLAAMAGALRRLAGG